MEVMERAMAREKAGFPVLHLEVGEPDFAPPPAVVEACSTALEAGRTHYTDSRGLADLRAAIAADKSDRASVSVSEEQVIVTNGTSSAMLLVFALLLNPGDEILLATPHYPCYPNFIRFFGGVPRLIPSDPKQAYAMDPSRFAEFVSERTAAILVSSPANPTGAVQDEAVLKQLAALGVPLIADEIYDGLILDHSGFPSTLAVTENSFVLDGFSKRYAMTGFRLGYVIAPQEAVRPLQVLQQNLFISANDFVQHAGLAALQQGAAWVEKMRRSYRQRMVKLADGLESLGIEIVSRPRGGFYLFADFRHLGMGSVSLANRLLEEANLAVAPGVDFGKAGEGFLRFSCAAGDHVIDEALHRLKQLKWLRP